MSQIDLHAKRTGRDPSSIQLVAVTKSATFAQMQEAYELGIRHFGENRLQLALPKIAQFPKDVVWHFIGALQSNKVGKILEHFSVIHSVDSLEIARQIAKRAQTCPELFLQVNISQESTKRGFSEKELIDQFDILLNLNLNFTGLMTMALLTADVETIRYCFRRLRLLRDMLSAKKWLPHLSMGICPMIFRLQLLKGPQFYALVQHFFKINF